MTADGEVASRSYLEYVELEQAAAVTLNFEPLLVPGLLQTAAYARAVTRRLGWDASDDQVNALVEFRLDRQKRLLDAPEPPKLSFVLDESVIHLRVGGAEVMEEQVRHLRSRSCPSTLDWGLVGIRLSWSFSFRMRSTQMWSTWKAPPAALWSPRTRRWLRTTAPRLKNYGECRCPPRTRLSSSRAY
jgi:Domain of unknown function (DUF5753)